MSKFGFESTQVALEDIAVLMRKQYEATEDLAKEMRRKAEVEEEHTRAVKENTRVMVELLQALQQSGNQSRKRFATAPVIPANRPSALPTDSIC